MAFIFAFTLYCPLATAQEDLITVFVPSVPGIESLPADSGTGKNAGKKSLWKDDRIPEADILMSLIRPYAYAPQAMDRPKSFAMIFQADDQQSAPVRKDLLGDVEEIRYLEEKAWGANVELAEPGLYQFLLEGKPVWNPEKDYYLQQYAKLFVPVLSDGAGWDKAVAQGLEIVPLSRPYGLVCPALFTGRLINNDKAVANAKVAAGRINTNKKKAPTRWHIQLESRTDAAGVFSIIFNEPGWWFCEASIEGDPLKGTDGELKEVKKSAIIWIYVDGQGDGKK